MGPQLLFCATNPRQPDTLTVTVTDAQGKVLERGSVKYNPAMEYFNRNAGLKQIGVADGPRSLQATTGLDNPNITHVTILGGTGEILQHGSLPTGKFYEWLTANAGLEAKAA
jgi:hypothetical protein